jgi:hypothetical protein
MDTNWYPDTGATHHMTSELNNLTMRDNYRGHNKVHTASVQGIDIAHVGHSIISNHDQNFHLRNILHVPNASKNLLFVHCFTHDNRVFLEFHPFYFLIKDHVTRKKIHIGGCVGGLYPLISSLVSPSQSQKHAFIAAKLSHAKWHSRLGHPSLAIVSQIIRKNKLPCVRDSSVESVFRVLENLLSSQCVIHVS